MQNPQSLTLNSILRVKYCVWRIGLSIRLVQKWGCMIKSPRYESRLLGVELQIFTWSNVRHFCAFIQTSLKSLYLKKLATYGGKSSKNLSKSKVIKTLISFKIEKSQQQKDSIVSRRNTDLQLHRHCTFSSP